MCWCKCAYQSPYSPDFNPIELWWSQLKAFLRQFYPTNSKMVDILNDLVVSISQEIGNPISVYYSQRRGWVFPPALPGIKWWKSDDLNNNTKAIGLLEELRAKGADWFGIVNHQKIKLWQNNPKLAEYMNLSH